MKKTFVTLTAIFLVFIMSVSLSGCFSDSNSDNSGTKDLDDGKNSEVQQPEKTATIEEQKCFEYEGLTVTATKLEDDSIFGVGVKLTVDNKSDKDYGIGCNALIVNDYMISDLFSCQTAAGKKSNESLYLSSSALEAAGIKNIGKIEVYFKVFDPDNYNTLYETECVSIKTSLFDEMDTEVDDSGKELYNKNGIKIVGKYVDENSFWGTAVLLHIENKSGKNITVNCEDVSVNGYMVDGLFSSSVLKDKYAVDNLTIFSADLEENDIDKIENIEFKIRIYDSETYKDIDNSEPVKIEVK